MATIFCSFASITLHLDKSQRNQCVIFQTKINLKPCTVRCNGGNPKTNYSSTTDQENESQNALLKLAWYSSEVLGIAASFFRSPSSNSGSVDNQSVLELTKDAGSGVVDRSVLVETIKEDFKRSYFVTGNLSLDAYEEDCEFADPAGSFKGLMRFKRNCTNFGSLIKKSNMNLMKWEDFEVRSFAQKHAKSGLRSMKIRELDTGDSVVYCHFLGDPFFLVDPSLQQLDTQSITSTNNLERHVEHWNVPKMALLKQILRPSKEFVLAKNIRKLLKSIRSE